jgi:hypothetical protein
LAPGLTMSLERWYRLARMVFAHSRHEICLRDIRVAFPPRYAFVRRLVPVPRYDPNEGIGSWARLMPTASTT